MLVSIVRGLWLTECERDVIAHAKELPKEDTAALLRNAELFHLMRQSFVGFTLLNREGIAESRTLLTT